MHLTSFVHARHMTCYEIHPTGELDCYLDNNLRKSKSHWRSSSCDMYDQAELSTLKVGVIWPEQSSRVRHVEGWRWAWHAELWSWARHDLNGQVELHMLKVELMWLKDQAKLRTLKV